MFNRILMAIQFLTILPVPAVYASPEETRRSMAWFPLAGFIVGILTAGLYRLLAGWVPVFPLFLLLIGFQFLLTGGLHLDGLADTFDGCMSGRSQERKLEIMKDSRLGTHGAVILILVIGLKWAAYTSLNDLSVLPLLIIVPVMGRFSLVMGAWQAKVARNQGLGQLYIGRIGLAELGTAFLLTLLSFLLYPQGVWVMPVMLMLIQLFKGIMTRILGGMTGDTLGALNELTETAFLILVLLFQQGS